MKTLARAQDKAEILGRLRQVRGGMRPRWGRMSAHQMICHLADAFRVAMGYKTVSHTDSLLGRTVMKWFALYVPIPWPPGIRTRPEIDQQIGGTPPADFARDVAELEALFEAFTAQPATFDRQSHPRLGPLSDRAWLRWAYLHMDHHLRQFRV